MPNFHFDENQILVMALILIRVSAFLFTWPVFSVFSVPRPAKILRVNNLSNAGCSA